MKRTEGLSRYPVYMDHHATTPVDPRVLQAMLPYFDQIFGNAASVDHKYGGEAAQAVAHARQQIASVINAQPEEIIFTSGATEADNLAILGVAEKYYERGNHIITCVTEHKAVLDTCRYLEGKNWQITYLPVDQYGLVDVDDVRRAITSKTVLISVMAANNEIGTLAPISEIGKIARECGVLFHTDATQAVGHILIDVKAMRIDLLSMSAHKIYGPKGIGALYVRKSHPRVRVAPQIHGGGHERNMRSGTLNVAGIVGFGRALELANKEMPTENQRLSLLRNRLWTELQSRLDHLEINGHPRQRLPHNLNFFVPGVENRSLLLQLMGDISFSAGSACTSAKVEPSHVISATGHGENRAHCSVRFGLGRENTEADISFAVGKIISAVKRLKQISTF